MTDPTISITIDGIHDLELAHVWPDGDTPDDWDATTVLDRLAERGLARGLEDWGLDATVTIRVERPNPHYTQPDALFPDVAPPPTIVSTAEAWT